jgi:hypothetical protein
MLWGDEVRSMDCLDDAEMTDLLIKNATRSNIW